MKKGLIITRQVLGSVRGYALGPGAPWIAVVPLISVAGVLLALPALYLVWISVYRNGFTLSGFADLFADAFFRETAVRTISYTFITVSLQIVLGLGGALAVQRLGSGGTLPALVLFLPYVVPSIVAVVMWRFAVEEKGLLSHLLSRAFGFPTESWMGDWILVSLILISVWQFYPFVFVSVLARLRQIPGDLYLSGQLDGAGRLAQFWHITLPALRPTLVALVLLRIVFMATKFDTPWLLAGRTANRGASTFAIYVYENGFRPGGIRATPGAAAVVIVALGAALVIFFIMVLRRHRVNG